MSQLAPLWITGEFISLTATSRETCVPPDPRRLPC